MQTKINIRYGLLLGVFCLLINNAFSITSVLPVDSTAVSDTTQASDTTGNDSIKKNTINYKISASGPEEKVKYIAKDSIEFDNKKKIIRLVGDAKVEYGKMLVEADIITVFIDRNEVLAVGLPDSTGKINKVKFKDGDEEFNAPAMRYNFDTKKGKIIEVVTQEGETYLHAEKAKKMPNNEIYIASGKITTCDHDDPHFHFHASKLKVIPGKSIIAGPTNLRIRGMPTPVWVPFGIFPNNSKRQSGVLIPAQGEDNGQFGLKGLGFHWAINDYVHAEAQTDLYFGGTFRVYGKLDYRVRYAYNGMVNFQYNNVVRGIPETDTDITTRDMSLRWTFNQDSKAHPNSRFSINIDAKTPTFNQTQNLTTQNAYSSAQSFTRSSINFGWNGKGWSFNSSAAMNQNFSAQTITADFPSFTFNKTPYALFKEAKSKLVKNITLSHSFLYNNTLTGGDSTFFTRKNINNFNMGARMTHKLDVGTSYKLGVINMTLPGVTINQYGGFRNITKTSFSDTASLRIDTAQQISHSYDVLLSGMQFNTKIFGIYKFKPGYRVQKIRHTITPQVSISYNTDYFARQQGYIRTVYDSLSQTINKYSIYDINRYKPNAANSLNLTYGLLNILDAKVLGRKDTTGIAKKVAWINSANLAGSYNALADSMGWSDYVININANPGILRGFNINFRVSPYELDSNGKAINKLLWTQNNFKLGQLKSAGFNFTATLNRRTWVEKVVGNQLPQDDFDWTINARYTFDIDVSTDETRITNSLDFNGNVKFSKNWNITYGVPFDFKAMNISTYSNVGISRDLHCWTLSLSWLPFSDNTNYTFTIRPKSGMLQDLKYEKVRRENVF